MKLNKNLITGVLLLLALWAAAAFVLNRFGLLWPIAIAVSGAVILGASAYAWWQAKKLQKVQATYEEGIGTVWTERIVISFCTLSAIQSAFFYFGHDQFRLLCPQGKTPLDLTVPLSEVESVTRDEDNPDLLHLCLTGGREYAIASAEDNGKILDFLTQKTA